MRKPADAVVISHQVVLRVNPKFATPHSAAFDNSSGLEEIDDLESHFMPILLWRAMGSPQTITLTVVPGDTLNHEEPNHGRNA